MEKTGNIDKMIKIFFLNKILVKIFLNYGIINHNGKRCKPLCTIPKECEAFFWN